MLSAIKTVYLHHTKASSSHARACMCVCVLGGSEKDGIDVQLHSVISGLSHCPPKFLSNYLMHGLSLLKN